jgi:hypothetical protein
MVNGGGLGMRCLRIGVLGLAALAWGACSEDNSDRGVLGPEIDVHCAAERSPRPGVGDTAVHVVCPPTGE